jgi:hypothetical protein
MDIVSLFYDLDEFMQHFEPLLQQHLLASDQPHRQRSGQLCLSEVMTILVLFHGSHYRDFKHFYTQHVCVYLRGEFPRLVSYQRLVELIPRSLLALTCFLHTRRGACRGLEIIDSTALRVCHNLRINGHRVMAGLAQRGKTSTGWFYGFKLHLVLNDRGELLAFGLTPGNTDDRAPVESLTAGLLGLLVGDKGYLSQALFERLFVRGLKLITRLKKNMKNRLLAVCEKLLLRKRALVETVIDQLKNIQQIEHSRHRSPVNYFVDIIAGLVAYTYGEKLPSLHLDPREQPLLQNLAV